MSQTQIIFSIIAAIMFMSPFFFWGFIRFWDKQSRKVVWWHKKAVLIVFGVGMLLFVLFLLLAIFL